jgi:hypothetical protein
VNHVRELNRRIQKKLKFKIILDVQFQKLQRNRQIKRSSMQANTDFQRLKAEQETVRILKPKIFEATKAF